MLPSRPFYKLYSRQVLSLALQIEAIVLSHCVLNISFIILYFAWSKYLVFGSGSAPNDFIITQSYNRIRFIQKGGGHAGKDNSGLVGCQCCLGDPQRMCGRCGTALPGDRLDPATTSSEEHVGRIEPFLLSVAWGKKIMRRTGDPSPCEGNESELNEAGKPQLILPHRPRENAVALSEGLDC